MTKPFFFGESSSALYGVLHMPAPQTAHDRGVVICAPLGYENVVHYRNLAVLARHLAEAGHPVLRFDWPAVGDSAGNETDPDLVARWIESITVAARTLRHLADVDAVDVVGLRIGATLAAVAAARGAEISDLVLWAPFTTGASYLREMRAFHRLAELENREPTAQPDRGEEVSGFLLSRDTIDDLLALDLLQTTIPSAAGRRILIAGRDGLPDRKLVDHLSAQGTQVDTDAFEEMRVIGLRWNDVEIPTATFESIATWLRKGAPAAESVVEPETTSRHVLGESHVLDHVLVLGGERARRVAVLSLPETSRGTQLDSWVVFPTTGHTRRIGPNRMWTSFARYWAAQGMPSARIDVLGAGDSDGPDVERLGAMYADDVQADVHALLAELRERYGAKRFATVGLCSGGYTGLYAALEEPDVAGVVLVNPQTLLWNAAEASISPASDVTRSLLSATRWKLLLRGEVLPHRVTNIVVRAFAVRTRQRIARALSGLTGRTETAGARIRKTFAQLAGRGCSIVFVYSDGDPGVAYAERHLGGPPNGPGIRVEIVPGPDHTFRPLWSHTVLRERIEPELRRLGLLPEASTNGQTAQIAASAPKGIATRIGY